MLSFLDIKSTFNFCQLWVFKGCGWEQFQLNKGSASDLFIKMVISGYGNKSYM